MKIDLTCPVELWHYQLPARTYPVCTLSLYNLSDKPVRSIQAVFLCYDENGEQLSRSVERAQGLNGDVNAVFEMAVALEDGVDAKDMDLTIEKVWFEDGTVWRRGASPAQEFTPNALPQGRRLEVLRYVAGADAVGYPVDQGAVWMCVCGRPNAASADSCRRCHRDKHALFTRCNEAAIEKIIFDRETQLEEKARKAREDAGALAQKREEKQKKRRKTRKRLIVAFSSLALITALTYGVYHHGIPFYRYYTAGQNLSARQYAQAKEIYVSLDDYRDSATLALECDYRQAEDLMETGTLTSLQVAQDMFDALGNYENSAENAFRARYLRAEKLSALSRYEEAIALYDETLSYADARDKRNQAEYLWAKQMMDEGNYEQAREKLLSLGDYQDASALSDDCVYLPATACLNEGDYEGAIALFTQIEDYSDVRQKLRVARYGRGDQLFEAGDYDAAAEMYLGAGEYLDAYRKATACLYEPAMLKLSEGDYESALDMFSKILSYSDSQARMYECALALAGQALEKSDYDAAKEYYSMLPSDDPDGIAGLSECAYRPAIALFDAGDLQGALALFETVPDYLEAADYINQIKYRQALDYMNARDYENAVPLLTALGSYMSAERELTDAKYGMAVALFDQGEYQAALDAFAAQEEYLESADYTLRCRYALAKAAEEGGDLSGAMTLYQALDDYGDSADRARACAYQLALQALGAEDLTSASAFLESAKGYSDADELYAQTAYQLGESARMAGDLKLAAEQYTLAGSYQDAREQAQSCYDAYYLDAYETARAALDGKDYETAVKALEPLDRTNLTERYADIADIYTQACYGYASALYDDKKPFEALVYFNQILDYKDVSTKKLDKVCYRILGRWVSATGIVMEFRADGTCTLDGRDYYFYAKNYSLETGDTKDSLAKTYQIVSESEKRLSLKNIDTNSTYKLTREEELNP